MARSPSRHRSLLSQKLAHLPSSRVLVRKLFKLGVRNIKRRAVVELVGAAADYPVARRQPRPHLDPARPALAKVEHAALGDPGRLALFIDDQAALFIALPHGDEGNEAMLAGPHR